MSTSAAALWHRDAATWRLIALGYLPWLAGLNLAWEIAHASLYTLWKEAETAYIAFSIAHCTLGDVAIGAAALLSALILRREPALAHWWWSRIAALTVLFGAGYTIFSEWMNVTVLRSWTYSDAMPRIDFGGFEIGLSPLAQWLVVPPLALYLARKTQQWRGNGQPA